MNNFTYYIERTVNLAGFKSGGLIYNLALAILHEIQNKSTSEQKEQLRDANIPNLQSLMSIVDKTKNQVSNIARNLNETELPPLPGKKKRSINFHNYSRSKIIQSFYVKVLPTHYIFLNFLIENGYISETFSSSLKQIYNALNQIYANPDLLDKENPVFEKLISLDADEKEVLYTSVEQYINKDKVISNPVEVAKMIQLLFDRKVTSESNQKVKITYNEAIRVYTKLSRMFQKIKDLYSQQGESYGFSNKEIELLASAMEYNLRNPDDIEKTSKFFSDKKEELTKAFSTSIGDFLSDYKTKQKTNPEFSSKNYNDLTKYGVNTPEKAAELIDLIATRKKSADIKRFNQIISLLIEIYAPKENISKDDDDIEAERAGLNELPTQIPFERIPHKVKDGNFKIPDAFDRFINITGNKKLYLQGKEDITELVKEYAEAYGDEIKNVTKQVTTFGDTRTLNILMNTIIDEKDSSMGPSALSQYGDPYAAEVSKLKKINLDIYRYLEDFQKGIVKKNELITFIKDIQEETITQILYLYKKDAKSIRDIKKSDIIPIFKIIYDSKEDKTIAKGVKEVLKLINRILESYREEVDLSQYFKINPETKAPRKPFMYLDDYKDKATGKMVKELLPFWFNPEDPFNKKVWFFTQNEIKLIQTILKTRNLLAGGASNSDMDEIYLDFITIMRLALNGHLKKKTGEDSYESLNIEDLNEESLKKILVQYRADSKKEFEQHRIDRKKEARMVGTVKSSEKLKEQKELGIKTYSKADVATFKRELKKLNKIIEITKSEDLDELLSDYFRIDYIKKNSITKEVEYDELKKFYETYNKIIKIKTSFSNISQHIRQKPSGDAEIKDFLIKTFKSRFIVSDSDIKLAKSIFKENESVSFFNIKFFVKDFLAAKNKQIEDIAGRLKTDINIINLPELDDKNIAIFLKKIFKGMEKPTPEDIQIARIVFDRNDPETVKLEGKINVTFFKLTFEYFSQLKEADRKIADIDRIKQIVGKETVADIISPNSTSKYSNILYLELTDLSKEIKFSRSSTPITMILSPDTKDGDSGSYKIYVSKHYLDDFLIKNDYLSSEDSNKKLNDKEITVEGVDINQDEKVLVINGKYETIFTPYKGELTVDDIYNIYYGQDDLTNPIEDLKNAKTAEEVMGAIKKNRKKVLELERTGMKLQQKASGQKVDKMRYIEDELFSNSKELLDLFQKNSDLMISSLPTVSSKQVSKTKSNIEKFKEKIDSEIDAYRKLIYFYRDSINDVAGSKKIENIVEKIKEKANQVVKFFFKFYDNYINQFFKLLIDLIKEKNRYFLSIEQTNSGSKMVTKIIFNKSLYSRGMYSTSYESRIKDINDFIEHYANFNVSSDKFILLDIKDLQEKFLFIQEEMEGFLSLVENDSSNTESVASSAVDIELESNQKSIITNRAVLVENFETGYKKVQILKPNKLIILHDIKSKYEIK
jgi:hypothetical protein